MSSLQNRPELQQFLLSNVVVTGRVLGTGSYGSVLEVNYQNTVCAAKKIHHNLLDQLNEGVAVISEKYQTECSLMTSLRHPNIVQFLGLFFEENSQLPLLVMEKLDMNLDVLLNSVSSLSLPLKTSILEDAANGLVYLHCHPSPILHRDLTANNILLTDSLRAKISDLGNSRIPNMIAGQLSVVMSQVPGTLVYMPPEAVDTDPQYGASLDVFSFGHLSLYTIIQEFPGNLLPSTFPDPQNSNQILARTEVERRKHYLDQLEHQVGRTCQDIVDLIKNCLDNTPSKRPSTEDLLRRVKSVKANIEKMPGTNAMKISDICRVHQSMELAQKEKRIQELEEMNTEKRREVMEKTGRILRLQREKAEIQRQLEHQAREHQVSLNSAEAKFRDSEVRIMTLQREKDEANSRVGYFAKLFADKNAAFQEKERALNEALESKASTEVRLRHSEDNLTRLLAEAYPLKGSLQQKERELQEALASKQLKEVQLTKLKEDLLIQKAQYETELMKLKGKLQKPVPLTSSNVPIPLSFKWNRGPDMPFGMDENIQAVIVDDKVCVGGGNSTKFNNDYVVMSYNTNTFEWDRLRQYKAKQFGMLSVNNKLVLIGGTNEEGELVDSLGVYDFPGCSWSYPYLPMPEAHAKPLVASHEDWIVVTGCSTELSPIRLLNTQKNVWHAISPLFPAKENSVLMKSCIVQDKWYILYANLELMCISMQSLINQVESYKTYKNFWETRSSPGISETTLIDFKGNFLALGGKEYYRKAISTISCYIPEKNVWNPVGDLPPDIFCRCAVFFKQKEEIWIFGGNPDVFCCSTNQVFVGQLLH